MITPDNSESDVMINVEEHNSNYAPKVKLIKSILDDIKKRKDSHYKNFGSYKNLSMYSKSLINTLNAVSICSMATTFTPVNPAILILALSTTTLSSLASDSSRYRFENAQSQYIISTIQRYREVSPTA